jgi:hypothetical protein
MVPGPGRPGAGFLRAAGLGALTVGVLAGCCSSAAGTAAPPSTSVAVPALREPLTTDPASPVAIAASPFSSDQVFYGGYDCNFYPADGTAWVASSTVTAIRIDAAG